MKKAICLLVALALLMIPSMCVSAETADTNLVGVSNAVSDDVYDVTVRISTDYLCAGLQAEVAFDSTKITYVGEAADEINVAKGKISVSKASAEDINGKWFDLKFTSKTMLFADDFTVSNVKGVKIINNEVSVNSDNENYTYGDLNVDGKINILDFIGLSKLGIDSSNATDAADCNLNGELDSNDLVALKKLLLLAF